MKITLFKKIILILSIFITVLVFQNCSDIATSFDVPSIDGDIGPKGDDGKKEPKLKLDGIKLYTQHCASCHNPFDSSTKTDRSFEQISGAITSQIQMQFLAGLSTAEVQAITDVLNGIIPVEYILPPNNVINESPPTKNRVLMASTLAEIFLDPTNPDQDSVDDITNYIALKVPAFGYPCTRYDAVCPQGNNIINYTTPISPTSNSLRKGYTNKVCNLLTSRVINVTAVIQKASIVFTDPVNDTTVRKVHEVFYPGITADQAVIDSLINIATEAQSNGMHIVDQWQFVLLPLCLSSSLDLI